MRIMGNCGGTSLQRGGRDKILSGHDEKRMRSNNINTSTVYDLAGVEVRCSHSFHPVLSSFFSFENSVLTRISN